MGINSDAELIYGIPVEAYDEDGEPTQFWSESEDGDDWLEFVGGLEIVPYGHYENPDGPRGILTHSDFPKFRGDCWDPTPVPIIELDIRLMKLERVTKMAQDAGLNDVKFYRDGQWNLVASYG